MNNYKLNSVKKFSNVNLFGGKNFFHICSILNSSTGSNPIIGSSSSSNPSLNSLNLNDLGADSRLSDLQLVPFAGVVKREEEVESDLNLSSYGESFPWLVDENGSAIDFNKPVSLFDAVKLMSSYINARYQVNPDLISEAKLSEILRPLENNKDLTVLDLYKHVSNIYNQNRESLIKDVEDFSLASNNTPDPTNVANTMDNVGENLVKSRPLGSYGDVTMNEVLVYLRDLKWDVILDRTQLTVNAFPLAFNFVSFSLVLKSYMKFVHNRPFDPGLSKKSQVMFRNRQLGCFLFIGAPLLMFSIKKSGVLLKDIVTVNATISPNANLTVDQNILKINSNESGLFMIISNLYNKIPNMVKLLLRFFLLLLVVIKLLGFNNIFEVFFNLYYLKMYLYITCSLLILYLLLY